MTEQAVAEGVYFLDNGRPRLIAGRRKSDGRMKFPLPTGPEAAFYDRVDLAPEGKLWSYTVQRFRPKTPPYIRDDDEKTFTPFPLGYVEFEGQVICEGRIIIDDASRLKIGLPMKVVLETFPTSTRGVVTTYAFAPVD